MVDVQALKRDIKVCMFDQYGTVVDMQAGLTQAATEFLVAKGWRGNPYQFVTWWRRTHFENSMIDALLGRAHTSYRRIGEMSVAQVMERAGIVYDAEDTRRLVACIERLKPFPEVPTALARLQQHYKLVVLSNGDPDMLEEARKHHGIPFDAVISVAEANAFKPARATYETAARKLGLAMDQVLFIANHEFDCVGAKAAGMRAAFINRRRRPFADWPHQPDLNVQDMTVLADLIA